MFGAIRDYFRTLGEHFGRGWTRFWFTPSDPYVLGAIRLLTGLVVVYLHATLAPDLVRFFGPQGWLPVETVRDLEAVGEPNPFAGLSYLNYLSTPSELWTAHLLGLGILILFTIGWRTRITSILGLIVILSDVNRAPMITSSAEPIATMLMLYLCIGPSGSSLSVDRWLAERKLRNTAELLAGGQVAPRSVAATVAIRLMQVHLALIYGLMAGSQLMGDAWWSGMGMWWLIARTDSRLIDLTGLAGARYLVELWSQGLVLFEFAFAILIWNRLARPLLLALSVLVWCSLALVTGQVPWAALMLIGNLAFIPSETVRAAVARFRPSARESTAGTTPLGAR